MKSNFDKFHEYLFFTFVFLLIVFFVRSATYNFPDLSSSAEADVSPPAVTAEDDSSQDPESVSSEAEAMDSSPETFKILIDPGHQQTADYSRENAAPGLNSTVYKVATGARGVSTEVWEYVLVLDVALKLETELKDLGYQVALTRKEHDVHITNKERGEMAKEIGADILVSLHADGSSVASVQGVSVLSPAPDVSFIDSNRAAISETLSTLIVDELARSTGARNRGVHFRNNLSILNWSAVPSSLVEIGFMSNPEEDEKLQTEEYQEKIARGIARGIDKYFNSIAESEE
jgi:N-acetylmuramoyl-L-alanine amidase